MWIIVLFLLGEGGDKVTLFALWMHMHVTFFLGFHILEIHRRWNTKTDPPPHDTYLFYCYDISPFLVVDSLYMMQFTFHIEPVVTYFYCISLPFGFYWFNCSVLFSGVSCCLCHHDDKKWGSNLANEGNTSATYVHSSCCILCHIFNSC